MEQTENAKKTAAETEAEMDEAIKARKADFNQQMKFQYLATALSVAGMILGTILGNLGSHAAIKKYDKHF